MKTIIIKEKRYERGKSKITYWVRIKFTSWIEHISNISWFWAMYNLYPIACFDTLKEAERCKTLYDKGKWKGIEYSQEVK